MSDLNLYEFDPDQQQTVILHRMSVVPWCDEHDSIVKDGVCDWVWGNSASYLLKKPRSGRRNE